MLAAPARTATTIRLAPTVGATRRFSVPTTFAIEVRAGIQPGLRLGWSSASEEDEAGEFSFRIGQHGVFTVGPTTELFAVWPSTADAAVVLELTCWHTDPVQAPQPRQAFQRMYNSGSTSVAGFQTLTYLTPEFPNTLAAVGEERTTDQLWFTGYLRAVGAGTGWYFLLFARNAGGTLSVVRRILPVSAGSATNDYAYDLGGSWRGDLLPVPSLGWRFGFHNPTANTIALEWLVGTISAS